jgi:hypothetical protein
MLVPAWFRLLQLAHGLAGLRAFRALQGEATVPAGCLYQPGSA